MQREHDVSHRVHEFRALLAKAEPLPAPVERGEGPWRELVGRDVLLSAPHEVEHFRDGKAKWAEPGTGALAFAIARRWDASAMCTAGVQGGDPSWDRESHYLDRASALGRRALAVVDLHMMSPRGVDIGLGLGPNASSVEHLADMILDEAQAADLRAVRDFPFRAEGAALTSRLQRRGIPALQVELSVACFEPRSAKMCAAWTTVSRSVGRLLDHTD